MSVALEFCLVPNGELYSHGEMTLCQKINDIYLFTVNDRSFGYFCGHGCAGCG